MNITLLFITFSLLTGGYFNYFSFGWVSFGTLLISIIWVLNFCAERYDKDGYLDNGGGI